jgi:hypothetical protein
VEALTDFYSQCLRVRSLLAEIDDAASATDGRINHLRTATADLHARMDDAVDALEAELGPGAPLSDTYGPLSWEDPAKGELPSERIGRQSDGAGDGD